MQDDLIRKIAKLMAEQSAAYTSLQSLTIQLIAALTRCEPVTIESLSRSGETELFRGGEDVGGHFLLVLRGPRDAGEFGKIFPHELGFQALQRFGHGEILSIRG